MKELDYCNSIRCDCIKCQIQLDIMKVQCHTSQTFNKSWNHYDTFISKWSSYSKTYIDSQISMALELGFKE